ncbi:MAG: hypothetical protein ABSA57_02475 [Candidatus Acidiferrales bacterium]
MTLRSKLGFAGCSAWALLMLASGATVSAQSAGPLSSVTQGPYQRIRPGPGRFSPDDAMGFLGFEAGLGGGKTVTGVPFTATFSQQTTQVFADGNHIQRTTSGTLARDGNGRFRRDMTLPAIGDWATSGNTPPHVVLISDPVAGANYILQPGDKTARKRPLAAGRFGTGGGAHPQFAQDEATTTSLGTQIMNGVSAQGTRTIRTIPVGAIGNEKPIVITVERWYSPDLQMNVMIKRSDPRTGDNVFQLTNIVRAEPDASLFQVPPDYTMKEGGKMGFHRKGQAPPPPQN